jgi:hypothetical protein
MHRAPSPRAKPQHPRLELPADRVPRRARPRADPSERPTAEQVLAVHSLLPTRYRSRDLLRQRAQIPSGAATRALTEGAPGRVSGVSHARYAPRRR